jgi:UDPglucose--hexose-1-phosphate uridylyltransferase
VPEPLGDLRFDPLTREWVNVVGHRQARPNLPAEGCPFCPGGLEAPEPYEVRWFENRWPAFAPGDPIDVAGAAAAGTTMLPAVGAAEVVLFSPQHDASLATLPHTQVRRVVDVWAARTEALLARPEIEYVLVFENRGREVGATIDHPHGQIYGYPFVPPAPEREAAAAAEAQHCPVCEEVARELAEGARIVAEQDDWIAYVPFAAAYPYGMRFAPRSHTATLTDLDDASRDALAALLQDALGRYDRLWPPHPGYLFPYLLWFHQAPAGADGSWHVHAHTAPPLRAEGVQRYVASGELGSATLANPVVPELAARELRDA